MIGCSTVRGYKSEDGRYVVLKGKGEVEFQDGTKIKSHNFSPISIPKIEIED